MKYNKGFGLIGILIVLASVVAVGGIIYRTTGKDVLIQPVTNSGQKEVSFCDENKLYENKELGFSFCYPINFGDVHLSIGSGDKGKIAGGYLGEFPQNFKMFLGATTTVFSAPMEPNASDVKNYPTQQELSSLTQRGYKNEEKINANGEKYILIYGQDEGNDMPYIGKDQMVAIFELKSSTDFKAIGFQLIGGDQKIFLDIINTVDIFKSTTISETGNNTGENSSQEIFKNQPGAIKSITVRDNNQWVLAVDLLSGNPKWLPGVDSTGGFFINQNSKIRNLIVTQDTKTYDCGPGPDNNDTSADVLNATSSFIAEIKTDIDSGNYTIKGQYGGPVRYMDINGSTITAIYAQCLP